jgi:hypothetical protein
LKVILCLLAEGVKAAMEVKPKEICGDFQVVVAEVLGTLILQCVVPAFL